MAKLNVRTPSIKTAEGATAKHINAEQQLRRSVMACMLWENSAYEEGQSIAKRIADCVSRVAPEKVAQIAIDAREKMKLRHVPLLIVREMARLPSHRGLVAHTLAQVIQRPDELTEFLAIYWKDKREPLSAQVKKGLAKAFVKFNAYSLAKYNRDGKVKLKDVLFLCHAKPKDAEQEKTWKELIAGTLASPDTWEVALSAGKDKKETWDRLIREGKLGGLAFLRNLRNMGEAGLPKSIIRSGFKDIDASRVLPFRFISAAAHAPDFEPELEALLFKSLEDKPKLAGHTVILVDVSGSMDTALSAKSQVQRLHAACGIAMLGRELCDSVSIYTFSHNLVKVPPRRGFALSDAINKSQEHGGTYLGEALVALKKLEKWDRIIVITDEQSHDKVPNPDGLGYVINVSTEKNGIGYGPWVHIDGWSDSVIEYITESERKTNETK